MSVYVIHHNGKMLISPRIRNGYLRESSAKGIITVLSRRFAENKADKEFRGGWYGLSKDKQKKLIDEVKAEFEIVEYVPKGDIKYE